MPYPLLVQYGTEAEYRRHFEHVYCSGPIKTFDGIKVRFRKNMFDHCFFESSRRDTNKDTFSIKRAERIDWIKESLQDPKSERYAGWDRKKKRHNKKRRVTIVMGNYVAIIQLTGSDKADFITAYLADTRGNKGRPATIDLIRSGPKWL
ncbi:MAG: hypothetical protein GY941_04150 [Planctomycetes bacterium]|nr:hypothetical protein [Planctomycetota bacterium]